MFKKKKTDEVPTEEIKGVQEIINKYIDDSPLKTMLVGNRLYINTIQVSRASINVLTEALNAVGVIVECTSTPLANLAIAQ